MKTNFCAFTAANGLDADWIANFLLIIASGVSKNMVVRRPCKSFCVLIGVLGVIITFLAEVEVIGIAAMLRRLFVREIIGFLAGGVIIIVSSSSKLKSLRFLITDVFWIG